MRIGILPALKRRDGGIYQYTMTFLRALHDLSTSPGAPWPHEFSIFSHRPDDPALGEMAGAHWSVQPFRPPWAAESPIDLDSIPDVESPLEQDDMRAWFEECGIELMIYPSPHRLSFESGLPFVMSIHDLQHLLQPEFPEVSAGGEWRRREYVLRNAARSATLLIAESGIGREDILRAYGRYGVDAKRVKILPYLPDPGIDLYRARSLGPGLRERYGPPERYLFYPAQFWPHKNHVRLIEAIGWLRRERGLVVSLVLTGSGGGEIRERVVAEVHERAAALGVAGQVRLLGYVSDEDVAGLYAGAVALAMPTFFGPTNIPFLEAWALDCPVLTSRIRGIVEQVGDAAVTVDPMSVRELAEGIARLWTDEPLRESLVHKGRERIRSYTPVDYRCRLKGIIDEAVVRVESGRRAIPTQPAGKGNRA